jgi:hypothetical protein
MSTWRYCSSCRKEIAFEQIYWECSVSTCARVAKTGLFFCSVPCWEAHLPTMRHREAWAVEKRAPSEAAWRRQLDDERRAQGSEATIPAPAATPSAPVTPRPAPATPRPATTAAPPPRPAPAPPRTESPARRVVAPEVPAMEDDAADEILIVVSKLKKYIRARSGMNTSDGVMPVLSEHLRKLCDAAIRHATEEGRKTVLDRDVKAIL